MTIVANLDFSADLGQTHCQGVRPTCLAFALSDLNRHANNVHPTLSAEYLYRSAAKLMPTWQDGYGLQLIPALEAVAKPGQPTALACPYTVSEPTEQFPCLPDLSAFPANESKLYVSTLQAIDMKSKMLEFELQNRKPIGLVLRLTESFYKPVEGIVAFSNNHLNGCNHAVIAVGLGTHAVTHEPHVLIRNTWGVGWGNAGNAWLPFKFIDIHAVKAFKV